MKYRKHVRLSEYDYSQNGYYFVTICTNFKRKLFEPRVSKRYGHELTSDVVAEFTLLKPEVRKRANIATAVIENELLRLPRRFPNLEVDFYVFMPDHLHAIFTIKYVVAKFTLPKMIQAFKSLSTKKAKQALQLPFKTRIFQPNYYEHIIRNEHALDRIRRYILNNPNVEYQEIDWGKLD